MEIYPSNDSPLITDQRTYGSEGVQNIDECFICMEIELETQLPINLDDITSIKRECKCHAWVHPSCYANWVVQNMSCPVCTLKVEFIDVNVSELGERQRMIERQMSREICNVKFNVFLIGAIISFVLIVIFIAI